MSKPINDLSREAIQRTMSHHAGDAPDASAFAEAAISTWQQMAAQLMPVIGTGGVDVLFNRSLHLTCISFPWLSILVTRGTTPHCLQASRNALRAKLRMMQ
jgi:hypothetical protein